VLDKQTPALLASLRSGPARQVSVAALLQGDNGVVALGGEGKNRKAIFSLSPPKIIATLSFRPKNTAKRSFEGRNLF